MKTGRITTNQLLGGAALALFLAASPSLAWRRQVAVAAVVPVVEQAAVRVVLLAVPRAARPVVRWVAAPSAIPAAA